MSIKDYDMCSLSDDDDDDEEKILLMMSLKGQQNLEYPC